MRELVIATLELNGFDVVGATVDGTEAIRCFEALDPPPDAIVLAERMPGLSGVETAERILAEGDPLLRELDAQSLAWRGKRPKRAA